MKKFILVLIGMGMLLGCEPRQVVYKTQQPEYVYVYEEVPASTSHSHSEDTYVYYDDSHNHSQVIIVEDNGYDPYYYEFTNNFQEFCYAEGTPYHTTTCWVEWCYDHWLESGWYIWDEWCEQYKVFNYSELRQ